MENPKPKPYAPLVGNTPSKEPKKKFGPLTTASTSEVNQPMLKEALKKRLKSHGS